MRWDSQGQAGTGVHTLLNRRRGLNLYRGFESLPLRQIPTTEWIILTN